jgi:hypothetical protein
MRDLSGARAPSQPRLFYDYKFKLSVLNRLGGVGRRILTLNLPLCDSLRVQAVY